MLVLSSFTKKKKVQGVFKNSGYEPESSITLEDIIVPIKETNVKHKENKIFSNNSTYDKAVNKEQNIYDTKAQTKTKKFDIKSAIIYSSILERPYK